MHAMWPNNLLMTISLSAVATLKMLFFSQESYIFRQARVTIAPSAVSASAFGAQKLLTPTAFVNTLPTFAC